MTLQVPLGTVINVTLNTSREALYVTELAATRAKAAEEQAALAKVYTLKELCRRMNMGRTTLLKYLNLPERHGEIRHRRAGVTYLVSEQAVREWFGDTI